MKAALLLLCLLFCGSAVARDAKQVRAFKKAHPCPVTGKATGSCPGFVVDHVFPLCGGGADTPANMAWQTYAASKLKDKREIATCAFLRKHKMTCAARP